MTFERLKEVKSQEQQGYEMKNGHVSKILNIYASAFWFRRNFIEKNVDNERITRIQFAERVKSDWVKQYNEPSSKDVSKYTIAWVISVDYENHFGSLDTRYYYILYRTRWFNRWANTYYENLKKYLNHDGHTFKLEILKDALDKKRLEMSTLVVVTADTHIWYMQMKDVIDCYQKWGSVTDKYNQVSLGIPKEMFSDNVDVNKY